MTNTIVPVILSGGAGVRLWPISRESHPKPFILLPDGQSLLQKTFARACQFKQAPAVITITNQEYFLKSKAEYETAGLSTDLKQQFLLEPFARNTAGAIALAALQTEHMYGADSIMLVLPADHLITPIDAFADYCQRAFTIAATGRLVTFGIQPTTAETGYGYIECGAPLMTDDPSCCHVSRFVEKPTTEVAQTYLASDRFLWNSGMFCFKASVILEQLKQYHPELFKAAQTCWNESQKKNANPSVLALDEATFQQLPSISIDYAVMEKSPDIAVINCALNWQDIGSWESYRQLFASDNQGNTILGDAILIDSENNFIHSQNRMVTSIGISNLTVIDTPDAILISHRDRVQDVRQIVKTLRTNAHESCISHKTVIRPWGTYTVLEEGPSFKIKRIEVKPGASLSLQKHQHRSEHWVVVHGTAKIINDDKECTLETNESTFVAMNTKHRLSNPTTEPLIIIEVQTGSYLGEDDITRIDDSYGRVADTIL